MSDLIERLESAARNLEDVRGEYDAVREAARQLDALGDVAGVVDACADDLERWARSLRGWAEILRPVQNTQPDETSERKVTHGAADNAASSGGPERAPPSSPSRRLTPDDDAIGRAGVSGDVDPGPPVHSQHSDADAIKIAACAHFEILATGAMRPDFEFRCGACAGTLRYGAYPPVRSEPEPAHSRQAPEESGARCEEAEGYMRRGELIPPSLGRDLVRLLRANVRSEQGEHT